MGKEAKIGLKYHFPHAEIFKVKNWSLATLI
jgi:hypothetical protein